MKKNIKELSLAIVLAFVSSFMLFIYEPITMYLSNSSDFWFDIYTLLYCTTIAFAVLFCFILFVYSLFFVFFTKIFKNKKNVYYIALLIGYIVFITTYIQGNYLAGKLPVLDGKTIEWSSYTTESIISVVLLLVASFIAIFSAIKFKLEKTLNVLKYVTCGIFAMLFISLITVCTTKGENFKINKYAITVTNKNLNKYSSNKNLIVFLLDSIDSKTITEILQNNEEYKDLFTDFTYFPNTVGGYAFTRDNVPLLLAGKWNENKKTFTEFNNEAMAESKLLEQLKNENYNINIYYDEVPFGSNNVKNVKNFEFSDSINIIKFAKQEIKYDLFKYLPYYLKRYSKIETMNFNRTRKSNDNELFLWNNSVFYYNYLDQKAEIVNDNEFKYIHLEGAHFPFDSDKNFNKVEKGTYEDKIEASIKIIEKYLQYLKDNNIYDNSAIIIISDHGFWYNTTKENLLRRQNPMLYIKGVNEKHEMQTSDISVSFEDFQDICKELLNGKQSSEIFENIDTSKPRRFLLQYVGSYDYMEEYYQHGYANDFTTLEETGNVYKR